MFPSWSRPVSTGPNLFRRRTAAVVAAVPVPGRTTDGAPAMVPSVPAFAVTLKYRENDFQVRRASERGPPRDAATARLSWRKDAARTIDNSRPPYDVLFLFPFLSSFSFFHLAKPKSYRARIRVLQDEFFAIFF